MISRLLYHWSARLPCRLIYRGDNQPYLERYYLGQFRGRTAYLHRFVAQDGDEGFHDHPWKAVSLCLCGWYRSQRLTGLDPLGPPMYEWEHMRIFKRSHLGLMDFHKINRTRCETWTLFIHGKRIKRWGFLKYKAPGVLTHTPVDTPTDLTWWETAPKGADAKREPYRIPPLPEIPG